MGNSNGFKQSKVGLIPQDWTISTVGESLVVENNKRKPLNEEERSLMQGAYPYYGPTKIQDYIDEFNYDGTYALIAEDGDHFLKYRDQPMTQLVSGKFNVNNHAHVIKGTSKCSTDWFYWFFNRRSVFSHITRQGAGRYKLNKASLEQLPIAFPDLKEQQRIVSILSTWDEAIDTTQQLITQLQQRNKGLAQKLLTGKKRLKGFNRKWNSIDFKSLYRPKKVRAGSRELEMLSVTKNGIVSQSHYFNKNISSEDTSNYLVAEKGDMVMSGLNFWMGSVDVLTDYSSGAVSPAYKVFSANRNNLNLSLSKYFIRSDIFLKAMIGSSVVGASIVRRNLDSEALDNWTFNLAETNEQEAIAKVLEKAELELKLQKKKLDSLKEQKKGLMQKLLMGQIRTI